MEHLTPALCEGVFKELRDGRRDRKWTFYAVNLFWAVMAIRNPDSLEQGIHQTRKTRGRDKLWPRVNARARAFGDKARGLGSEMFRALFEAFVESLLPHSRLAYASWMAGLREQFTGVFVIDGSRLDAVVHKLGILRQERGVVLPGCLTVYYDLLRGIPRRLFFYADAAKAEMTRALETVNWIPRGALLVGDRLYAVVKFFTQLGLQHIYGVFRLNGTLTVKRIEVLSRHQWRGGFVEDVLVEVGSGRNGKSKIRLRLIRYRGHGFRRDILTSVLDSQKLSWEQILNLYGLRWTIERMFLNLKETLDLKRIYSSHPNLVAQQVYGVAIVYTVFRIAQAQIATEGKVLPEQISPAKLFPLLADAANDYCIGQLLMLEFKALNPGKKLKLPRAGIIPTSYTTLEALLVRRRSSHRRRRRFCAARKRWKSFAHVRGGPTLLRIATDG
jgi:hypothetical protein